MESSFNPYTKWLGIPQKHQPPTHYRLLGVEQFEADADIIERAADRQMVYLRSLQSSEHAQAAQRLLNEISAAKVCLLDEKRKAEYDERLRQSTPEEPAPPVISAASSNGSGIHQSGGSAVALAAAPPAAKPPAQRASAAGKSGIRTAQPLTTTPPKMNGASGGLFIAPLAAAAGAGAPSGASKPQAVHKSNVLPLVIGAVAAGGFLLLSLLVVAVMVFPSGGNEENVADVPALVEPSNVSSGGLGTIGVEDGSRLPADNDDPSPPDRTPHGNSPPDAKPDPTHSTNTKPVIDSGHSGGSRHSGNRAIVEIDGQFLPGSVDFGERVLSDRNFTFTNVARELRGLEFTRWPFGQIPSFKLKIERPGDMYLILPPKQYEEELPSISIAGWQRTELTCDVSLGGGRQLKCLVFQQLPPSSGASSPKEITVNTTSDIWPIVAVSKIYKRTRLLSDVVSNDPQPPVNSTRPNIGDTRPNTTSSGTPTSNNQDPSDPEGSANTKTTSQVTARRKVPSSDVLKPVSEKLSQLYKIDSLNTPEEKRGVAKDLLDFARQPSDKPEERYVMLATSAKLAADGGDLQSALNAVELLTSEYDSDASAMQLHLARLFAKSSLTNNLKQQQIALLLPVIDDALAADQFDGLEDLFKDLLAAKLTHPELAARRKNAAAMGDSYRKVASAQKVLAATPDDPAANRLVGEYYCFQKSDWDQGLPYLAKADDASLQAAAKLDMGQPESASDQIGVADVWFDLAMKQNPKTATQMRGSLLSRAQKWYDKAALEASGGLDQAHAKKRLTEVEGELEKIGWIDIPREATIVAAAGYTFDCYLNGKHLFTGSYDTSSTSTTLKRGDILMFKATKSSYGGSSSRGFACVILRQGATPIATGLTRGWTGFVPANRINWYQPNGVASSAAIQASNGVGHQDLAQQTGIAAPSIWYAAANTYEAFFYFRVP